MSTNFTIRAYKGHFTRAERELEKLAAFVKITPSPRGFEELEFSFQKYKLAFTKVESSIDAASMLEETVASEIDEYLKQLDDLSSKLSTNRQMVLEIINEGNNAIQHQHNINRADTLPSKPRICETLKPFQLNNKHTPTHLRSWINKFTVYHSTSSLQQYSIQEQHMFFFSCIDSNLETRIRESDTYNQQLNLFGDNSIIQILQEEFNLTFPLFNRRLDFFRYKQSQGQKFSDFIIELKQKGEEADLHSLDISSLYIYRYITGVTDSTLRERFLKLENPTLDQLKKEARAYEIGKQAATAMDNDATVSKISHITGRQKSKVNQHPNSWYDAIPREMKVKGHIINAIISPELQNEILLSWHDLQALNIIPKNFPSIASTKVAKIYDKLNAKKIASELKKEFHDVLNTSLDPDRFMDGPLMKIHLTQDSTISPVRNLVARKVPLHFQNKADECVEKLLHQGVIKRVDNPTEWVSSGHFVPKPNGTVRLVTDYTDLNKYILRPIHPFPTGLAIIHKLSSTSKWFAKLDAVSGYFQIPLDNESSILTTFLIPQGRFRYTRAPMGLNASGDEWCYRSDLALEDMLVKPFDQSLQTELLTDASRLHGLGFCLIQREDQNTIRLISCGSCSLTTTQSRYATVELECLAIQWAVNKCEFWLRGIPRFNVITDHRPLLGLFKKPLYTIENPRLQRMREKLIGFNFDVEWRAGKNHLIADALSRAPVWPGEEDDNTDHIQIAYVRDAINAAAINDLELNFFAKYANTCTEYKLLCAALKNGQNPRHLPLNHVAKQYGKIWDSLSLYEVEDYTLVLFDGHRIVVPNEVRPKILQMLHVPHQGLVKTKQYARRYYYWPGMNASILNLIEGCHTCTEYQPSQPHEPFLQNDMPNTPMTHVGVDLFDALGKIYIIMVDRFSGYLFVKKITNSSTGSVIKSLLKWFQDFGFPDVIRSDGGPCFRHEFKSFCEQHMIKHELSSAFNPTSNGLAEAAVKNAKRLVLKCNETSEDFEQALSEFRLMPRADGYSPADLMFGRKPRGILPSIRTSVDREAGQEARQEVLEKSHHRHSSRPCLPLLSVGDKVLLQDLKSGKWYGRKLGILVPVLVLIISGIISAFCPEIFSWMILRTIQISSFSLFSTNYVYSIEIVGKKYRSSAAILMAVAFCSCVMMVSGLAYWIKEWKYLSLAICVPSVVALPLIWFLPESPRWLLNKGRLDHLRIVLKKFAKLNNKEPFNFDLTKLKADGDGSESNAGITDLFKTPNIRKKVLVLIYINMISAFSYFGLSLFAPALGSNPFVSVCLAGAAEIPGDIIGFFIMDRWGRRWTIFTTFVFAGIFSILVLESKTGSSIISLVLFLAAKICIAANYLPIVPFTTELLPTDLRNMGISITANLAVGGMAVVPFIVYMGREYMRIPLVITGAISLTGGLCTLLLPETLHQPLPETIPEAEEFGKKMTWADYTRCIPLNPANTHPKDGTKDGTKDEIDTDVIYHL
ncbi:Carcinine transporter [Nymphon striatum]|nr:Carcinine transporter [Nymphon striatum]